MDTISRENNSMLPVGAIIVGVIALLLAGYSAISISKVNRALAEQQDRMGRIDAAESSAGSAAAAAERASRDIQSLTRSTQDAFNQVSSELGKLGTSITKLEESTKRPAPAPASTTVAAAQKTATGPAVAGPGEYVVKPGDTGMRISQAQGISIGDLQAVNPGVNWGALKVGQKLKLPAKK
jgi:LysM repeat protein